MTLEVNLVNVKTTVAWLQKQTAETEAKVNNLEQYSKRCCLEIQGIPYKDNENTEEVVVYLVKQIGINITGPEISVAHRLALQTTPIKIRLLLSSFLVKN